MENPWEMNWSVKPGESVLPSSGESVPPWEMNWKRNKGLVGDLVTSFKQGVEQLPGQITGLLDIPAALITGERPISQATDWIGDKTGLQFGKWAKDAESEYSQGYRQAQKDISAAWDDPNKGALDVAGEYIAHPGYIANQVVGSIPGMVAGGVGARALMTAGRVAVPAAEGVAARFSPGYLERAVGEEWAAPVAAGIGEGAVTSGQQMEQYQGTDQQRNALASAGAGLVTGAIGGGVGKIANKLGLETAETAMAKGLDPSSGKAMPMWQRMAGGAASEGLQEFPQSYQEKMWQNYVDGKPLTEGALRQSVEGMLSGLALGSVANVPGHSAFQQAQGAQPTSSAAGGDNFNAGETLGASAPPQPSATGGFTPEEVAAFRQEQAANQQRMMRDAAIRNGMAEINPETNTAYTGNPAPQIVPAVAEPAPLEQTRASEIAAVSDTASADALAHYPAAPQQAQLAEPEPVLPEQSLFTPNLITPLDRVEEIDAKLETISPDDDSQAGKAYNLLAERANITDSWPKAVPGSGTSFSTESGIPLNGQYALMEAGDLTTSHDEYLRPVPVYPAEMQPQEHEHGAAEKQIQKISQKLDPSRLGESSGVATGAPVVGADGLVESGRARTIALKRAYSVNDGKGDQGKGSMIHSYREYIKSHADRFGLTPDAVDAMQKPVLVRIRQTPVNRAEFVRQANPDTAAQINPPGQVAKAQTHDATGEQVLFDADMKTDVLAAVKELSDIKENSASAEQSIDQTLALAGMSKENLSPEGQAFLGLLFQSLQSPQMNLPPEAIAPERKSTNGEPAAARSTDAVHTDVAQEDRSQPENAPGNQASNSSDEAAARAAEPTAVDQAEADFQAALNDLGAIVRNRANVARMIPENTPGLLDALVRLFDAAIRMGYYDAKKALAYVKEQLKADERFKVVRNRILPETYRKAAKMAVEGAAERGGQEARKAETRSADEFIKSPDGSIDFGEITQEQAQAMRRQTGKIRLNQGIQNADGTGYGLAHIEENHGKQIRNAGFASVEEFVSHVSKKFNEILQAGGRAAIACRCGRWAARCHVRPTRTGHRWRFLQDKFRVPSQQGLSGKTAEKRNETALGWERTHIYCRRTTALIRWRS